MSLGEFWGSLRGFRIEGSKGQLRGLKRSYEEIVVWRGVKGVQGSLFEFKGV